MGRLTWGPRETGLLQGDNMCERRRARECHFFTFSKTFKQLLSQRLITNRDIPGGPDVKILPSTEESRFSSWLGS